MVRRERSVTPVTQRFAAEVFKTISVPRRMRIFTLAKRESSLPVKRIAERLRVIAPAVSQHLKILQTTGLVRAKRRSHWIPYELQRSRSDWRRRGRRST